MSVLVVIRLIIVLFFVSVRIGRIISIYVVS